MVKRKEKTKHREKCPYLLKEIIRKE